jgi:multiple sugar transport system permease protein
MQILHRDGRFSPGQRPLGKAGRDSLAAAMVTLSNVFFCTLAGYAFSKLRFPGREQIFFVLLMTLMVPFQVNPISLYKLMDLFKWIDTHWALIVPSATSVFGIYLMRQYILSIPDELLDSARVDGCSEFGIFCRIVTPLSLPGVATLPSLPSWDPGLVSSGL